MRCGFFFPPRPPPPTAVRVVVVVHGFRFKLKFHPEEHAKRQAEVRGALLKRLGVFKNLLLSGRMDNLVLDVDKQDDILKIVDAAVILMEGGTEFDLTILEEPVTTDREDGPTGSRSRTTSENTATDKPADEASKKEKEEGEIAETASVTESNADKDKEKDEKEKDEKEKEKEGEAPEEGKAAAEAAPAAEKDKVPDKPLEMDISAEQEELQRKAKEYQRQQKEEKRRGKRKKSSREKSEYSYESEESESDSASDSDMEPAPPGLEEEPLPPGTEGLASSAATSNGAGDAKDDTPKKEGEGKEKKKEGGEMEEGEEKEVNTKPEDTEPEPEPTPLMPRPLHRTNSIFLRNLAPTITKQEVEALCKRYPGFKRVALQDPQPERHFFRRGWATYFKTSNIKDICWNLNNIRLRDCELGATLNRELKQRVRPINGLTVHKAVARNDVKLAARIIQNLDHKWSLWTTGQEEKKDPEKEVVFNFVSNNPVLHNITDYLVEEGSYEEDELLGTSEDDKKDMDVEVVVERDDSLLKVLDRMVMYLRLVHSLDYYSANEYPNEDEMPHRCGIMHARGMAPGATSKFKQSDVAEYTSSFEAKLKPFLERDTALTEAEAVRLGKKSPDVEVEKFVQSNTQELAKDKWLCPLSGKKFKGPDFVRKHIFNKHAEKVEEVKKEVVFFNNYLMDPKRPSLPEHPGNRPPPPPREPATATPPFSTASSLPSQPNTGPGLMGSYPARTPPVMYAGSMPSFGGPSYGRDGPDFPRRGRGYGRRDPRPIIEYRDLDAPDEMDIF